MNKLVATVIGAVSPHLKRFTPFLYKNLYNLGSYWEDKVGRPMIYPYTYTAVLMTFPFKFYVSNGWSVKYYLIATLLCMPFHRKLSKAVNSKENKKRWKQIRKEWYGPHHDDH
ncbi:uncharacterized protein LOC142325837 [Lycorma delicatula]|uniref:uncharacterized protein LOC142325837 n=1 Tax=Lycorma delicatula TaxID=130591 RepID=UPI003F518AB0